MVLNVNYELLTKLEDAFQKSKISAQANEYLKESPPNNDYFMDISWQWGASHKASYEAIRSKVKYDIKGDLVDRIRAAVNELQLEAEEARKSYLELAKEVD